MSSKMVKVQVMLSNLFKWFGISDIIDDIQESIIKIDERLASSSRDMQSLAKSLVSYEAAYEEYVKRRRITDSLELCTREMQWAKDLEGRYLYANKNVREGLLHCSDPIGLTDLEIAEGRTRRRRDVTSTSGKICIGSDLAVLEAKVPMSFLEVFVVHGKQLILEVHKTPMKDADGVIVGTVGVGVDVTETHQIYKEIQDCKICSECTNPNIHRLNKLMEVYDG